MAGTPTSVRQGYGFMSFFGNTDRQALPGAPESAFAFRGAGSDTVYRDPENDPVVAARWIQGNPMDGVVSRVLASLGHATAESGSH